MYDLLWDVVVTHTYSETVWAQATTMEYSRAMEAMSYKNGYIYLSCLCKLVWCYVCTYISPYCWHKTMEFWSQIVSFWTHASHHSGSRQTSAPLQLAISLMPYTTLQHNTWAYWHCFYHTSQICIYIRTCSIIICHCTLLTPPLARSSILDKCIFINSTLACLSLAWKKVQCIS